MRTKENVTDVGVYWERERIALPGSMDLFDSLLWLTNADQIERIPVMSRCVIRIELNSPLILGLGKLPIPFVGGCRRQRGVRFRQSVIELHGLLGSLPRLYQFF